MISQKPKLALMSYAIDNRPAKGTALYARKLIEHLINDKNFDVYLVHFDRVDDPLYARAHEILMPKVRLPFGSRFASLMYFFWQYRKNTFDIMHWFQPRMYPLFWLAPARKLIVTAHAAGDITAPARMIFTRWVFNMILTRFNNYLDAIIAVSEFGRREIIEYYKADPKKVFVTYNGGSEDFSPVDKAEAQRRIGEKYGVTAPFILDVARLQPHKNINNLIKGYIEMRDGHPDRHERLVIVGSPVYGHGETYALARNCRYKEDIQFVNYIKKEDLNDLYSAAEVFAFPSLNEGFGLPMLEAMASGTPVVTSDVTSLPEIAGDAAILVKPSQPESIADALHQVLSDERLRHGMIEKGLLRAKRFTWRNTTEATKKIYFSLFQSA